MSCSRRLLAAGDHMVVEQCGCGSVHVTIGAVTLRLASDSIPSLAATLDQASRSLLHLGQPRDHGVVLS